MSSNIDHIVESEKTPLLKGEGISHSTMNKGPVIGCRHVLAFLAFLGFFNVYCLRVNLSVALVAMVKHNDSTDNDTLKECQGQQNETHHTKEGEFSWDSTTQGIILGSFFYGYIVTQIPGGWLGEKFGGKWLFGLGVLCTAALTLLTPVAARHGGVTGLVVLRVLEGLGEGVTFPAMHAMWGSWAPTYERSKLASFCYSGAQLGTVISMPLSGVLCDYGFDGGWPSVFYVFGAVGCLWFVLWTALVHNRPSTHPRISAEERLYIESTCTHGGSSVKTDLYTPWLSIITSMPFWAILAAHMCHNWGFYTLLTCLPTYMKDVLDFDISKNGLLSGIPYLFMFLSMVGAGQLADFLRKNGYLSTTTTRKLFNSVGLLIPAGCLVGTGYVGCNHTLAVVLLTLAVGMQGIDVGGYNVNHLDIAPRYAGTLMGLTNCAATIPGFAGPQVVGAFTKHSKSSAQWRKVFFVSAAIYVLGALFYFLFSSGEEQTWAKQQPKVSVTSHVQAQQNSAFDEPLPRPVEAPNASSSTNEKHLRVESASGAAFTPVVEDK